jgi:hypothetical protein
MINSISKFPTNIKKIQTEIIQNFHKQFFRPQSRKLNQLLGIKYRKYKNYYYYLIPLDIFTSKTHQKSIVEPIFN